MIINVGCLFSLQTFGSPLFVGPFSFMRNIITDKRGGIYAKRIMRPSFSLYLPLAIILCAVLLVRIRVFHFAFRTKAALYTGPNDQQHKCVLHGPIHINLMRFRWAQKEKRKQNKKRSGQHGVYTHLLSGYKYHNLTHNGSPSLLAIVMRRGGGWEEKGNRCEWAGAPATN